MKNRKAQVVADGRGYPSCSDAFDAICREENVTAAEREELAEEAAAGKGDPNAPVDVLGRTAAQRQAAEAAAGAPPPAETPSGKPARKSKTTRNTRSRKGA